MKDSVLRLEEKITLIFLLSNCRY